MSFKNGVKCLNVASLCTFVLVGYSYFSKILMLYSQFPPVCLERLVDQGCNVFKYRLRLDIAPVYRVREKRMELNQKESF